MKIDGSSALVTGGGSGLGEAVARELARLGAKVAVLDMKADAARRVAERDRRHRPRRRHLRQRWRWPLHSTRPRRPTARRAS